MDLAHEPLPFVTRITARAEAAPRRLLAVGIAEHEAIPRAVLGRVGVDRACLAPARGLLVVVHLGLRRCVVTTPFVVSGVVTGCRGRLRYPDANVKKAPKRGAFHDAPKRTRTSTGESPHKALNLARLPIPPPARERRRTIGRGGR